MNYKLFYRFPVAPVPSVLLRLEILPLASDMLVAFHLRHRLRPFETVVAETRNEIVEDKSIGTFRTILGKNAYKEQIHLSLIHI